MRKVTSRSLRVALGGIALSLGACEAVDDTPLHPSTINPAEVRAPRYSTAPPPSDSGAARGAYVGAGY